MNSFLTTASPPDPIDHHSINDRHADSNRLRDEVHALAETAFHRHLISGHGDSEYPQAYQIVHQGKPMHLPLSSAHAFLADLVQRSE